MLANAKITDISVVMSGHTAFSRVEQLCREEGFYVCKPNGEGFSVA